MSAAPSIPPRSFEERLKAWLVPPQLYMRYRVGKEMKSGEREIHLLAELVDPARAALDVGANKGVWAWLMARHAAKVHAFEPNPKLFAELARNVGGRVTVHHVALSDATGEAALRIPRNDKGYSNQGSSLSAIKVSGDHLAVTVAARRLDDLDLGPVGFMKIDVEGHELAVLAGARRTIARDRPKMVVEIEEKHTGRPIEDMIAEVEAMGYCAHALIGGRLAPAGEIDLAAHHRTPAAAEDYIFNFVFLPA
jgi:FkbM family methyltransferase